MTRWTKEVFKCDRDGCGAVVERLSREGQGSLPEGWSEVEKFTPGEKHYCPRHQVRTTVFDLVDGKTGQWTESN